MDQHSIASQFSRQQHHLVRVLLCRNTGQSGNFISMPKLTYRMQKSFDKQSSAFISSLLGFISFLPPSSLHNTTMRAIKSCASTTATTNKLLFLCRIGREYEKTNLRLNVDSNVKKRKISFNILKIFLQFVNFIQTCELLKRFWKSSWNSLNFRFIPKVNESSTRRKNFANRAQ